MSDAGNILPQAEIDALFKQATGRNLTTTPEVEAAKLVIPKEEAPRPKKQAPVKQQTAVKQASSPIDNEKLDKIMETLESLSKRIDNLESSIEQIGIEKPETPDLSNTVIALAKQVRNESASIQQINGQLAKLKKHLQGTPGFAAKDQFVCSTCGTHGYLATPMKCSACGTEGWWGWWPEKK